MRLTSIDLYSNNTEVAALSFKDPSTKNPYIAQQVQGLDADEIVPKFYGTSLDGSAKYYDLVVNKREVVILVALNPAFDQNQSYSDLRDDLYRGIAASRDGTVQIMLKNGSRTIACLSGFVTKFETGLFSKTPQAQITIRCDDGMLRSKDEVSYDITKLDLDTTIVDNVSTAPHGFKFSLEFDAISADFTIQDAFPDSQWQWKVTPTGGFLVNDVLYFSSAYDGKTAYMVRGGTTTYLADKIELGSTWPYIFPGANQLKFSADGAVTWLDFSYYHTYWGV